MELAERCSSDSQGPKAGVDWREVRTGRDDTPGQDPVREYVSNANELNPPTVLGGSEQPDFQCN